LHAEQACELPARGISEAKTPVLRQSTPRDEEFVHRLDERQRRHARLERTDEDQLVPVPGHRSDEILHRQCDPVDLGRIGFGDDGNAHGGTDGRRAILVSAYGGSMTAR
jgi:hypothetical protein